MKDALLYEVVRLRTLRSTWWLTAVALLVSGLLSLFALSIKGDATMTDYHDVVTAGGPGVGLGAILLSIVAIFAAGHEYRYGTIRPTLSALPRRSTLMSAKVLVVAGYVLVIALLCEILRYALSLIILGHRLSRLGLFPGPMARVWIGSVLYTVVFALVGLALAALFRNIPAAIVIVIVMPLIAENLIRLLLNVHVFHSIRGLAKLLPFSAGEQVFRYGPVDTGGGGARSPKCPDRGLDSLSSAGFWRSFSRSRGCCSSGAMRDRALRVIVAALAMVAGVTACASKSAPSVSGATSSGECHYAKTAQAAARSVGVPPSAIASPALQTATVTTNHGVVTLRLDTAHAPCTVNSFAFLANRHYFDSTSCHRLTTSGIFVLQCGDPSGTGAGGPGYTFADENLSGATYAAGTVAMANSGSGTNGSQFFLVYADTTLAPNYTPFATITGGLDVVKQIAAGGSDNSHGPGDGAPLLATTIQKVAVTT